MSEGSMARGRSQEGAFEETTLAGPWFPDLRVLSRNISWFCAPGAPRVNGPDIVHPNVTNVTVSELTYCAKANAHSNETMNL
jgi:hypothetical protein